jgi:hypothetical protein
MLVRRWGTTAFESKVCSKGANTLTSLAVGLKVPTRAMMSSGQNSVSKEYPIPKHHQCRGGGQQPHYSEPMSDQANHEGYHRGAQQHCRGEHADFKGAKADAGQLDGHQDADEPITKRADASRGEQQAEIAPVTVGANHRRPGRRGRISKISRHPRSACKGRLHRWAFAALGLGCAALWP